MGSIFIAASLGPDDGGPANVAAHLRVDLVKCNGTLEFIILPWNVVRRVNLVLYRKIVPVAVCPPSVDNVR